MNYMGYIIITIVVIYLIYFLYETKLDSNKYTTFTEDGYKILYNNPPQDVILSYLPKDYVFIDYKYVIKGCSLSTYHRDVTSSQYVF